MCASTQFPVIVKNSSPKNLSANCWLTDDQLLANCRPTVDRQLADRFFGELFFTITGFNKLPTGYQHVTNSRPTVGRQVANISGKTCWPSVGQLSADRRPTVSWLSADSWPTVGLQVFWGALPHNYPISCNMKFPDYWKPSKLVFLKSHPGHTVKCFTINTFAVHHFTVSLQYFEFWLVESEKMFF